jgi:uncharacterized membrane protein
MKVGVQRVLRWVFTAALGIAAPLLLAGLMADSPWLLEAGVLTVMATPLVGAVIVTVALARQRDWPFTAVAVVVLAILASSLYAAARMPPPAHGHEPARRS